MTAQDLKEQLIRMEAKAEGYTIASREFAKFVAEKLQQEADASKTAS